MGSPATAARARRLLPFVGSDEVPYPFSELAAVAGDAAAPRAFGAGGRASGTAPVVPSQAGRSRRMSRRSERSHLVARKDGVITLGSAHVRM